MRGRNSKYSSVKYTFRERTKNFMKAELLTIVLSNNKKMSRQKPE